MRVGVAGVAVMDDAGQRVQLLQRHRISHPQVGGDQIPAGHAGQRTAFLEIRQERKEKKTCKLNQQCLYCCSGTLARHEGERAETVR